MSNKPRLHIFRAGAHRPMTGGQIAFSESDVAGMAASYDPALRKAPLVIGHPRVEDDAKGWVARLEADGPNLRAEADQIDPAFAQAVRAGRYGALSASFYTPKGAGNPKPGSYYLKHVGFLGAVGPAVLGLDRIELAAPEEGVVSVEFSAGDLEGMAFSLDALFSNLRDWLIEREGAEKADRVLPAWMIRSLAPPEGGPAFSEQGGSMPAPTPAPADGAAREAALKQREEALKAQEAAFAERQRAARKAEDDALLGDLIAQGRLAPAVRAETAAFMETLAADESDVVAFSEGAAKQTPREWFRAFLRRSGEVVSFAELSAPKAGEAPPRRGEKTADELHSAARALVKQAETRGETLSFAEAVRQAEGSR